MFPLVDEILCQKSTVAEVLKKLGLEKHAHKFEENEINYDAFKELEENDLRDLEIPIGPRARIRAEIKRIQKQETISKRISISDTQKENKFRELWSFQLHLLHHFHSIYL